jgi:hypothetical protein
LEILRRIVAGAINPIQRAKKFRVVVCPIELEGKLSQSTETVLVVD